MAFPAEFMATVVEADNAVADQFQGEISLIDRVYRDFSMEPGDKGETVNIAFPGPLTVHENADVAVTYQTLTSTKKALTLTTQPSVTFKVSDWVQLRANPVAVARLYVQPAVTALARYADDQIASKINATNFNSYSPVASVTARSVTLSQIRDARILLHNAKIPVEQLEHMSLVTPPEPYDRMLADDNFSKHDIVGVDATTSARQRAVIMPQYASAVFADHSMNLVTQMTSILMHSYAIGASIRPIAIPQGVSTKGSYINYRGIPIRALFDYSLDQKAWVLSFDFAMGVIVLRPECGALIYSALS